MIKLFRNIRKKPLQEGKTTNYLKYVIGEIVLLVIDKMILYPIRDNLLVEIKIKSNPLNTHLRPMAFKIITTFTKIKLSPDYS
jgi:hypothetical protein